MDLLLSGTLIFVFMRIVNSIMSTVVDGFQLDYVVSFGNMFHTSRNGGMDKFIKLNKCNSIAI